ncbi:hypothetical protein H480_19830 [Amycolatopsis vancoresmycina DSM 44592]|uniref:Uncharacterized protein n=1 Tax=Amycolatopsis vancoresmycina DSM 44592 TaxID=1292037 RepID=R1I2N3_9PSEU|nr:hypothetical protein H480_19830 [Amycolatopsis vancoresmycina DSM 44592]
MFGRQEPDQPDVLFRSPLKRFRQFSPGKHPPTRGFNGNGSEKPGGQRKPVIGRSGRAQNVFLKRLRRAVVGDRNGPDDVTTMDQPARFLDRTPDLDNITIGRTCPNATVHFELGQPRQREQQITDIPGKLIEKLSPVNAVAQRKPNLGVEAGRNVGGNGPGQAQDGNVPVDARGFPGTFGGEGNTAGGGENARLIGNGPHGGKADTEAPYGATGLTGGPQRSERRNTPRIERRTGVGESEFGVHKGHPNPTGHPTGHGSIGGVLGEFDEEPIPIGTNAKITLDVGVLDEPSGRLPPRTQGGVPKRRGPKRISGDGRGIGHRSVSS